MVLTKPTVIDKYLHVTQDGYDGVTHYIPNRRGNRPRKMTVHVMEGTMWGSWTWHHQVKASATVFISKQGVIWNVVPKQHGPWTNGDVNNPDAEIRAFMQKYGSDPNEWTLTIENEGYTGNLPYTVEQAEANVWQLVQWCKEFGLTADDIIRHGQINSVDRPYCPERSPYPFTTWLKKRVAEELGGTTESELDVPVYATPELLPDLEELAQEVSKFSKMPITVLRRRVRATRDTPRYQKTSLKSPKIGPDIRKGTEFDVLGEIGGWWITPWGTRVQRSHTEIIEE